MKSLLIGNYVVVTAKELKRSLEIKPENETEWTLWRYKMAFYNCRILGICIYRNFKTMTKISKEIKHKHNNVNK